ncbi:MAG: FAD-dependent oxidoreductase [Clostridia bacterium]|nr:FAD-dependent oxidoreductase [Clostridia bacterium]
MPSVWKESLETPVVDAYDVCVVGGGVAGAAAALAAARRGVRTCLIEKEYALGGLATLGLVVIYLPLCDGRGRQVIGGISEEFLKLSLKYGPGDLPACWREPGGDPAQRRASRYQTRFEAAPFMIALEEALIQTGVTLFYDSRFCGAVRTGEHIDGVIIENKSGRLGIAARAVVDATGDADVCFAASEDTVSDPTNVCTGWYFSQGRDGVRLHGVSDPIRGDIPKGHRFYAGDRHDDVTQHAIDGRRMIMDDVMRRRREEDGGLFPLIIPSYDGMRMTRRLRGRYELDESEAFVNFPDGIGLTGDWRKSGPVFCVPWRCLCGVKNDNLAAAGRCISVTRDMWDITRVIPTATMTGHAAGLGAALSVIQGVALRDLDTDTLRAALKRDGAIIENHDLFTCRGENEHHKAIRGQMEN